MTSREGHSGACRPCCSKRHRDHRPGDCSEDDGPARRGNAIYILDAGRPGVRPVAKPRAGRAVSLTSGMPYLSAADAGASGLLPPRLDGGHPPVMTSRFVRFLPMGSGACVQRAAIAGEPFRPSCRWLPLCCGASREADLRWRPKPGARGPGHARPRCQLAPSGRLAPPRARKMSTERFEGASAVVPDAPAGFGAGSAFGKASRVI